MHQAVQPSMENPRAATKGDAAYVCPSFVMPYDDGIAPMHANCKGEVHDHVQERQIPSRIHLASELSPLETLMTFSFARQKWSNKLSSVVVHNQSSKRSTLMFLFFWGTNSAIGVLLKLSL